LPVWFPHRFAGVIPDPMFDIGFSELVVIAVVALIVIGPERLPKAARTMGHLFGRLQRYVADVKTDIGREIELDELRKLQKQVQSAAQDLKSSVESAAQGAQSEIRSVEQQLQDAADAGATETHAVLPSDALPPAGEPGGELADAAPVPPVRQASLPGFDRI
jgi:sec-independent protein translocase protein TatB